MLSIVDILMEIKDECNIKSLGKSSTSKWSILKRF